MQIVCTSASAAARVLMILLDARLQLVRDFEISPVLSATPPITFTMLLVLPAAPLAQIRAIPDTTIANSVEPNS